MFWSLRNFAAMDAFYDAVDVASGSVKLLLQAPRQEFIDHCRSNLTFVQLEHTASIPVGYIDKFVQDFGTYWDNLCVALKPFEDFSIVTGQELRLTLPDLSEFGIHNQYTMLAKPDFSLVNEDMNILSTMEFTKKPFKEEQKRFLKFMLYAYYLNTQEVPDFVGMLYLSTGKFKFLEKHLYKPEYVVLMKRELLEFMTVYDAGEFPAKVGKYCSECSYTLGCKEYGKTQSLKNLCFDDEIDWGTKA